MKSLIAIATNPFPKALEETSYEHGVKFLDDTIARIDNNNPNGIYTPLLTSLKANTEIYKRATTVLQKGDQKSATETVHVTVDTIKETGKRLYNQVENVFGLKTPKLMEFFPKGKNGLNLLSKGNIPILLQIWNDKCDEYNKIMGDKWVNELNTLQTNWETVSGYQTGEKGSVSANRSLALNMYEPLGQNLFDLLLLIIQKNQPHAETAMDPYFDISILKHKVVHSDRDGLGRTIGNVKDVNNKVVKNVNIIITNNAQQNIWKGKTNSEGNWRTPNLPIGMYHITFQKETYTTQVISHEIEDDIDTVVNIVLVAEKDSTGDPTAQPEPPNTLKAKG